METYSPEDILIDNLSFKLNKGSSYITDRRAVSFWPTGSNVYKVDSGNRVLKIHLNAEDNSWLDPQSVMLFLLLKMVIKHLIENSVLSLTLIPSSDDFAC